MTHKDIYTKFMIEYDKANVTSSYPSLTEYEVATLLDKAYLALIAQKFTGNNPRRAPFEADTKAVADLAPLIVHKDIKLFRDGHEPAVNIAQYKLPSDYLYYVSSALNQHTNNPMDQDRDRLVPAKLVSHSMAEKFFNTPYNMPWVKIPVCYSEGNSMFVVYDPVNTPKTNPGDPVHLSYIKKPKSFVECVLKVANQQEETQPEVTPVGDDVFILDISQLDIKDRIQ